MSEKVFAFLGFLDSATKNVVGEGNAHLETLKLKTVKKDNVLQAKRLNYRTFPRKKGYSSSSLLRIRWSFVVKVLKPSRITLKSLETINFSVKKFLGWDAVFLRRAHPYSALARRPKEVRMGRGKVAKVYDWSYPARGSRIIYEFQRCFDLLSLDYIIPLDVYYIFEKFLAQKFYIFKYKCSVPVRFLLLKL